MNAAIRIGAVALLVAGSVGLGGCVYYPVRSGVVYSDPAYRGNAVVDYDDSAVYYAPAYYGYGYSGYYDPYGYGPGWYGWPSVGVGFYGSYWSGHHDHGSWHSGSHGGNWGGRSSPNVRNAVPLSRGARH